jgi:hypothetical protein
MSSENSRQAQAGAVCKVVAAAGKKGGAAENRRPNQPPAAAQPATGSSTRRYGWYAQQRERADCKRQRRNHAEGVKRIGEEIRSFDGPSAPEWHNSVQRVATEAENTLPQQ